jgi:hypothetical protein
MRKKMNDIEKKIWAAAFANEFCKIFAEKYPRECSTDGIKGFSCAEVADVAVKKFREAMSCDDKNYLLPIEEKNDE